MPLKKDTIQSGISRSRRRVAHARRGFTLIEAALTTVIVGTGVLAIVSAQQAYHMKNDWAQRTATGLSLANELRELTLTLPLNDPITGMANLGPEPGETTITQYDDVDDFAGAVDAAGMGAGLTFDPPVNALRQVINEMAGWSQQIVVENVLDSNISAGFTQPLGTTDLMRVTVTVLYESPTDTNQGFGPSPVTTLSWIITE